MIRPGRYLLLVHVAGNALLLWVGYYWLATSEASGGSLLWSAAVALAFLCGACWLHGAGFVYFRTHKRPFRTALRNLLPLLAVAVAALVIYGLLEHWAASLPGASARVASYLTLKIRKPVKPATVLRIFGDLCWLAECVIVPVLLLPLFGGAAVRGWRGFAEFRRGVRDRLYWIEVPLLLTCASWLPLKLLGWVPHLGGFGSEAASFVLRAAVAYLLFVTACLVLELLTSSGRPVFNQPKTVTSP